MFRSCAVLLRGQYKTRLKKRMVGYVPKVVPRKLKNNMVALRSEANTGYFDGYLKTQDERLDLTGRKLQRTHYDPILQRYCLFKETKIRGPFMTKAHITVKPVPHPSTI